MFMSLRTKEDWYNIPTFFTKHIPFPSLGIVMLGYFPYHTARIKPNSTELVIRLPRTMFSEIESMLQHFHLTDNKCVLIFESISKHNTCDDFALMLKDDYALIGTWDEVVQYDLKPFKS